MSEERIPIVHQAVRNRGISNHCPRCGHGPLDGYFMVEAPTVDDARKNLADLIDPPATKAIPGDMSICYQCNALLIFTLVNGQLALRVMNRREIATKKRNVEEWELIQKCRWANRRARNDHD